jgi:uncharacterized membrane protein/protein-disulfide isomerase
MTKRTRNMLAMFGLAGLIASLMATWVHYRLLVDPGYSSFCDINAVVSCSQAYLSRYGSIAGVPVALAGAIFFTLVLLLVWAGSRNPRMADAVVSYVFALSTIGLAAALYLAYASFFVLREVCPMCVATYVAVIGLFIVSGGTSKLSMGALAGRLPRDLRTVVVAPVALIFIAATVAAVLLFPREPQVAASQAATAPPAPLAAEQRAEFERWWAMQQRVDVPVPRDNARVLVVKFSDYQCPACKVSHYAYAPVLAQYKPEDVKYVLKQFPLNPDCNPAVRGMVHAAACTAAAAGAMARNNGKLEPFTDWLFAHQEDMTPASVRRAVNDIAGVSDFDVRLSEAIQEVKADAAAGGTLKVEWTPTFFINGRRLPRENLPAAYFQAAIDIELRAAGTQAAAPNSSSPR